jgi:ribose transport system permease protein
LIIGFGIASERLLTAATFKRCSVVGGAAVLTLALIVPLTAGTTTVRKRAPLSAMTVAILNAARLADLGRHPRRPAMSPLLINGLIMVYFGIESLIVTLGMGTLLTGITLWASNSATISGISSVLVDYVIVKRVGGISLAFFYAIALCAILWW